MESRTGIQEILEEKGIFISTTVGVSMFPMLRNRRDTIVIEPVKGRLKKYDVPLYKRGDKYVLHRIVKVTAEGYVICGDNCINQEYSVTDEDIIGVLTGFYRDEKKVNMNGLLYKLYCRVWVVSYPVRIPAKKIWMKLKRMVKIWFLK